MTRWLCAAALLGCLATPAAGQLPVPVPIKVMQPDEEMVFKCDSTPQYGAGVAVSSFTSTVTKRGGPDATCLPTATIKTDEAPTGTYAPVRIAPVNRHGCDFQVHILATMANTQKIACDAIIQVRTAR